MLTPVTSSVIHDLRHKILEIVLTPSANYTAGGDNCNLNALTAPSGMGDALIGFPAQIDRAEVIAVPFGFKAELVNPGSGTANLGSWLLRVEETGAALSGPFAELAAAAYPGGVLAGVFVIRLRGPKGRL